MHLIESKIYQNALQNIRCDDLNGKTIMITGATGMIGSCVVDALAMWNRTQENPCKIIAASRNEERARSRFQYCWSESYFNYMKYDVCDESINSTMKVDYIIHAASNADPKNFVKAPVETLMANVAGTNNLLKFGLSHGMKRFLFVSSGEMYGQPDKQQNDFIEDYSGPIDYNAARSCYPAGKRAAEVLCQSYIKQYDIDSVIVRPCHIFGPTMTLNDSRAVSEFLRNAVLRENIGMKSAGLVERSHCYVINAADAILKVLIKGEKGNAYNIADVTCQMTIRDFAALVANEGGCNVVFENPSDCEMQGYSKISRSVLNADKLKKLGWNGCSDCRVAIKETIQILRELEERKEK